MHTAVQDLKLDPLALIYPGSLNFPLNEKMSAYGLNTIATSEFAKNFPIAL